MIIEQIINLRTNARTISLATHFTRPTIPAEGATNHLRVVSHRFAAAGYVSTGSSEQEQTFAGSRLRFARVRVVVASLVSCFSSFVYVTKDTDRNL